MATSASDLSELLSSPLSLSTGEDRVADWVSELLGKLVDPDHVDDYAPSEEELNRQPDMPLRSYLREAWHVMEPGREYVHNWHIDAIADHLEAVSSGQIKRLCINIPPRHSKSSLVSVAWPTWEWTFKPWVRWLYAAHGLGLSTRDAVKSRRLIQSRWYKDRWGHQFKLTGDQNAKTRYENSKGGYRLVTSVNSVVIGEGGDRLIIDDPNGPEESDVIRQSTNDWFDNAWSTRKNHPEDSAMVVIMQRLHQLDVTGHAMASEDWTHLCLPSEFESSRCSVTVPLQIGEEPWRDPRTIEGEPLWPERYTPELLATEKRRLGSYGYAGQHQQRPSSRLGGIFKRQHLRYWAPAGVTLPPVVVMLEDGAFMEIEPVTLPDQFDEMIQSWDMAFKDGRKNSYVVGGVIGKMDAQYFLRDMVRDHLSFTATTEALISMSQKWPMAIRKLVEDKANGPAVMDALKGKISGLIPQPADVSKEARAQAISGIIESSDFFVPHPLLYSWVGDFIEELCAFPNAAFDDQVDMLSQALRYLEKPHGVHRVKIKGF